MSSKTLNPKLFVATLAAITFVVGCTKDKTSQPETDQIQISYETKIDTKTLPENRRPLAEKINHGQPISHDELTRLFVADQLAEYKTSSKIESVDYLNEELSAFVRIVKSKPYFAMKLAYEKLIEGLNENKLEIMYDASAPTMFHTINEARLQCFGGTSLNLAISRMSLMGSQYSRGNFVVILKPGHILPGQMIQTEVGFRLVGVETTGAGDAVVDFGLAKYITGAIRVVDANDYVTAQVFKNGLDAAAQKKFLTEALNRAAKKYGLPLDSMESKIVADVAPLKGLEIKNDAFNTSIFGFGEVVAPREAISRKPVGESAAQFGEKLSAEAKERAAKLNQSSAGHVSDQPRLRKIAFIQNLEQAFESDKLVIDFEVLDDRPAPYSIALDLTAMTLKIKPKNNGKNIEDAGPDDQLNSAFEEFKNADFRSGFAKLLNHKSIFNLSVSTADGVTCDIRNYDGDDYKFRLIFGAGNGRRFSLECYDQPEVKVSDEKFIEIERLFIDPITLNNRKQTKAGGR